MNKQTIVNVALLLVVYTLAKVVFGPYYVYVKWLVIAVLLSMYGAKLFDWLIPKLKYLFLNRKRLANDLPEILVKKIEKAIDWINENVEGVNIRRNVRTSRTVDRYAPGAPARPPRPAPSPRPRPGSSGVSSEYKNIGGIGMRVLKVSTSGQHVDTGEGSEGLISLIVEDARRHGYIGSPREGNIFTGQIIDADENRSLIKVFHEKDIEKRVSKEVLDNTPGFIVKSSFGDVHIITETLKEHKTIDIEDIDPKEFHF